VRDGLIDSMTAYATVDEALAAEHRLCRAA
jgi:hypothetical protein